MSLSYGPIGLIIGMMMQEGIFPKEPEIYNPKKELLKCCLPGCNNMTSRGFCCAEHCREYRILKKEKIRSKS